MFYRKKPIVIEAFQWEGFLNFDVLPKWITEALCNDVIQRKNIETENILEIVTLEGIMRCDIGNYIIKGVDGELYPCKKDIFEKTYDKVEVDTKAI